MHCIIIKECIKIHVAICIFIHLKMMYIHRNDLLVFHGHIIINIKLVSKIQTKMTTTEMTGTVMTATKMTKLRFRPK